MGTIIKSVAVENSAGIKGIIPLVSEAAKKCLLTANVNIDNVGMLINTGVYSENHLKEPALASLIQNRLNGKYQTLEEEWKESANLFSFDLHSGGGGIIHAFEVMDSFIQANDFKNGLIVSGDVKPETGVTENYNYKSGAAAVLVSKSNEQKGFTKFKTETFPGFIKDFESATNWDKGRFRFVTRQSANYLKNCVDCTVKTINNFIEEEQISWSDMDRIITSQSPKGFAQNLQDNLKHGEKVVQLKNRPEIYSSGLLFSLNHFLQSKELIENKNLLFVTVGAGITVSLAYYKNRA
ncbi:MAG: hypothetical protein ABFS16_03970 [Bacteroidota bacterium]